MTKETENAIGNIDAFIGRMTGALVNLGNDLKTALVKIDELTAEKPAAE